MHFEIQRLKKSLLPSNRDGREKNDEIGIFCQADFTREQFYLSFELWKIMVLLPAWFSGFYLKCILDF